MWDEHWVILGFIGPYRSCDQTVSYTTHVSHCNNNNNSKIYIAQN